MATGGGSSSTCTCREDATRLAAVWQNKQRREGGSQIYLPRTSSTTAGKDPHLWKAAPGPTEANRMARVHWKACLSALGGHIRLIRTAVSLHSASQRISDTETSMQLLFKQAEPWDSLATTTSDMTCTQG